MIIKSHYYFLLGPNPWPFIIRISSFNLILALLLFLKFSRYYYLIINLISTIFISFFWWIRYGAEFNLEGKNSLNLEKGIKLSIILFISSEISFFFSFFWSYFHFFLSPTLDIGLSWPPLNLNIFDFLNVPLINTLVLLISGIIVTIRHYYLIKNNKKKSNLFLLTTILLGVFFSILQLIEYYNSFFCIRDRNFGTSFFVLTGFHGIHVLIGSIFLNLTLIRSIILSNSSKNYVGFELASWYWHFVDVVWIFLYFLLYFITS